MKHTNIHTDIATTRLNRPQGRFSENMLCIISYKPAVHTCTGAVISNIKCSVMRKLSNNRLYYLEIDLNREFPRTLCLYLSEYN